MTATPAIITLLTDFGLADPYVGAMKGALLSINPDARIVDISHEVHPQQIEQAAFILDAAYPYFPPSAIHVAVVDPGVGTERLTIVLSTPSGTFLGPDNGVLSTALSDELREQAGEQSQPVALPPGFAAYALENEEFQRRPLSSTFHGRDIFGPAAAHLSLGIPCDRFGRQVSEIVALPPFRAKLRPDGSLLGRVIHIDRFGNAITTIHRDQVTFDQPMFEVCGQRISGLARAYAEGRGLMALPGSTGFIEIAVAGGNAAVELDARIGTDVEARPAKERR